MPFLSLVTLTFDLYLDLQTRPSEGPNTSSVWIWRKSVQRFPRYFIHKPKKTQTDGAKNRTTRSSLCTVNSTTTKSARGFITPVNKDYQMQQKLSFKTCGQHATELIALWNVRRALPSSATVWRWLNAVVYGSRQIDNRGSFSAWVTRRRAAMT